MKHFNDFLSFLSSDAIWSAHCTSNQESDLYSLLSWYSMKSIELLYKISKRLSKITEWRLNARTKVEEERKSRKR